MSAAENITRPFEIMGHGTGDRAVWLERRYSGLGASESPIILGASGWASILSLYYSKVDRSVLETDEPAEYLRWGVLLQDPILAELAARAGVKIALNEPHLRSTVYPWAIATPDSITADDEPVEAKNIAWGFDQQEWDVGIPEQYYIQCQHQIMVCGAQRCLFGALLWGSKLLWEWVPRDEKTIARIIKAGEEFWRCVETRTEPRSDGHPAARRILGKLATDEKSVELYEPEIGDKLSSWRSAASDLAEVRDKERKLKRSRDAYADAIAQEMGRHRSAYTATGWSFKWKKIDKKGFSVAPTSFQKFEIKPPRKQK